MANQYEMRLGKQGSTFRIGDASSGEKELLIYLLAIYALNVRDALILVDEPELHLHPKWQRTLLSLFERLADETGNQFVMATHSPTFVSPTTVQYVSRVYAQAQESRVVRIGEGALPELKHLFGIINSQNNERVFFADVVVLVEGISDRLFFEALCRHFKVGETPAKIYEVVSVGGKTLFDPYLKLLAACRIPAVVVADLDYVRELGDENIKTLFKVAEKTIKTDVLENSASIDGRTLVQRLEEAIGGGDLCALRRHWDYIKSRRTRLRDDLTSDEEKLLDGFVAAQRKQHRFVLRSGALEAYLPEGSKNKDLEKVIALTAAADFWAQLPVERTTELEEIMRRIASRDTAP